MTNKKLTPWFEPSAKPVRIGWYHTGFSYLNPVNNPQNEADDNSWWDGSKWLVYKSGGEFIQQNRYWRGLAQNPEVKP